MELGTVSMRVAFVLRSVEVYPPFLWFVQVDCVKQSLSIHSPPVYQPPLTRPVLGWLPRKQSFNQLAEFLQRRKPAGCELCIEVQNIPLRWRHDNQLVIYEIWWMDGWLGVGVVGERVREWDEWDECEDAVQWEREWESEMSEMSVKMQCSEVQCELSVGVYCVGAASLVICVVCVRERASR